MDTEVTIRDLGLVGDRRTGAVIDRAARVLWYCPGRFDRPSLFARLLDPDGGHWEIRAPGLRPHTRRYVGESGILETTLAVAGEHWTCTDWMPVDDFHCLCRQLSAAPQDAEIELMPRPGYGQTRPQFRREGNRVVIEPGLSLYASVEPRIEEDRIRCRIPRGMESWFVLADSNLPQVDASLLDAWRKQTLHYWDALHWHTHYAGPYEREVKHSLRALRLLTNRDNGGVLAAATLGLPEVIGGERNYDYRYVWLRDAAMIVSALTRAGSEGTEERRFLEFLCTACQHHSGDVPLPPFVSLDGKPPPPVSTVPWRGWRQSRPVMVGNGAGKQLQLDGLANVQLAAKLIYNQHHVREHWDVVAEIADYLAEHWHEPDHGIWEEEARKHYTTSKVVTAVALHFIAEHTDDPQQAARWQRTEREIRQFVANECLTADGAYAVAAGSEAVDVSAILFPVWDYCAADTPEMCATVARLERESSVDGVFYRRHLECFDARREGVFLAGTLWVAQYWIMRDDLEKAERILAAVLDYANDLGLFAEEADPAKGEMLGNFPQTFVHAALVGLVIDLRAARANQHKE